MEGNQSSPRARKRTRLSGSKGFAAESHHRSREAPLLNNVSTSPELAVLGTLPPATMTKGHLPPGRERGLLDTNEEENEYRSLEMMGRDMTHLYIVSAADTTAEDGLQGIMRTSIHDSRRGQGTRQPYPHTLPRYSTQAHLALTYQRRELATAAPFARSTLCVQPARELCRTPQPRSFKNSNEQQQTAATLKPWDAISQSSDSKSITMTKQRGTECLVDAQKTSRHPYFSGISKPSDFSLAQEASSSPKVAYNVVQSRMPVALKQSDPPNTEGYQSDESSCTLRNETLEAEKESQLLTRQVELVEWVPSQKHMEILAMCDTDSGAETSSGNIKWKARGHPVDNFRMRTQRRWSQPQSVLALESSKKRKHSTVDQGVEEVEEIAETPSPNRTRASHISSQHESNPETPSTTNTMTSRSTRTEIPSSDIDDGSSVSSFEGTPIKPKRSGTLRTAATRKVSLNQFRELPQLPVRNLSEILRARYSSSTTPTRNIQAALKNSSSRTLRINTPSTLGRSTTSNSTLKPGSFSDDEQFETSFRSAFDVWMDKYGEGIVQAAVKETVEREMKRGVKKAAQKDFKNAGVKGPGTGRGREGGVWRSRLMQRRRW